MLKALARATVEQLEADGQPVLSGDVTDHALRGFSESRADSVERAASDASWETVCVSCEPARLHDEDGKAAYSQGTERKEDGHAPCVLAVDLLTALSSGGHLACI